MKKLILLSCLLLANSLSAQIQMPAPSTFQKIAQDFGLGKIELSYSRPNMKGRAIFEDESAIAPRSQLWRTGANAATKIRFTDIVTVGGVQLDTGTYVLYTIPDNKQWEIVVNRGIKNWGTNGYKQSEDVVRFKVDAFEIHPNFETFTCQFANVTYETCDLLLMWGKTAVSIPIRTSIKDRLKIQVETALAAPTANAATYGQAANFYYEWLKDYDKALFYAEKFSVINPKAFGIALLTAMIHRDKGNKAAAKLAAEKCKTLATEARNEEYVRLAETLIESL